MTSIDVEASRWRRRGLAASAVLVASLSCDSTSREPEETVVLEARVRPSGDALDLLFVINSTNGGDRPGEIAYSVGLIWEEVFSPGDGRQRVVDLHLGVIDMDVGAGGYWWGVNCSDPSNGAMWVRDSCLERHDFSGLPFVTLAVDRETGEGPSEDEIIDAAYVFGCMAFLDLPFGCGAEQPLESLRLALTDRVEDGSNAGFFREGALLAVFIGTDEDDCSTRDPSFFDPARDDLAGIGYAGLRCFANADQLDPVSPYAELLLAQRPPGRVVTAAWLTVPVGWDGDLDVLAHDPELDWRTAVIEDFELCVPGPYRWLIRSPRLGELMVLTGGADLVWSMCDDAIYREWVPAIVRRVLERLDPVECLPGAPPSTARCEVALHLLDPDGGCPDDAPETAPGVCALGGHQWQLVETGECTALRPASGVVVPPGAWLAIRCLDTRSDAG